MACGGVIHGVLFISGWTIPIIFMLFWWKFSVAEIHVSIMIISVQWYWCRHMVPPDLFFEEHPLHKLTSNPVAFAPIAVVWKLPSTRSRSVEVASELWWGGVSVVYIVYPRSPLGQCFCTTAFFEWVWDLLRSARTFCTATTACVPKTACLMHTHAFWLTVTVTAVSRLPAGSLILHYARVRLRFRLVCSVWFVCANMRYLLKEHLSGMLENQSWVLSWV